MSGKFETEPYYNKSISEARQEIVKLAYIQTTKIPVRIITYHTVQQPSYAVYQTHSFKCNHSCFILFL